MEINITSNISFDKKYCIPQMIEKNQVNWESKIPIHTILDPGTFIVVA